MPSVLEIPPFYARDANQLLAASPSLLFVNVTWCPHCKDAKPLLDKVASALGHAVPVYSIDGDRNSALVKQLGVESYPTLLFVNQDGIKKFAGERGFDSIIGFVCENSGEGSYCKKK